MSSLKKIGDRIASVQSTHQVTASMKVVAVSRLKKQYAAFLKTQLYAEEMNRMIRRLIRSATVRQDDLIWENSDKLLHLPPLLKGNGKDKRYVVVVVTSDDGLSGASNLQVIQQARVVIDYLSEQKKDIQVFAFGTRGADILKRFYPQMHFAVLKRKAHRESGPYLDAERLAADIIEAFYQDRFDTCLVVYNQFKSVVSQRPVVEQLIPNKIFLQENPWAFLMNTDDADYVGRDILGQKKITLKKSSFLTALGGVDMLTPFGALDKDDLKTGKRPVEAYDYEPSDLGILELILPQYIVAYVYRVLQESEVSDNAARLMAMDNATRNAGDMLQDLNKQYRRLRQSKITTDIAEVFSGAISQTAG